MYNFRWINEMDQKLEGILCKKLEEIINIWIKEFSNFGQVDNATLVKEASVHKIKLKDQMIYLEPGTQDAREFWYSQFHQSVLHYFINRFLLFVDPKD